MHSMVKKLVPIIIIAIVFLLAWQYIKELPSSALTDSLIWMIPLFLAIDFALLIVTLVWNRKELRNPFRNISKRTLIALLLIFILALSLRAFLAPVTHRVYFDEDIYANIGQNILHEGNAILCNRGTQEHCYEYILNKQPIGHQFLFAVTYMFFGVNELLLHALTMLLGALSAVLVFAITYLLFKRKDIAIFSALLMALTPVAVQWSATIAAEPYFLFFALLSVLMFLIYFENQKTKTLWLSIAALTYALQIRPDGYLLLIPIALLFLLFDKELFKKIYKPKFIVPIAVMLILIMPTAIHTTAALASDPWGSGGKVFSGEYLEKNLSDNTMFLFENTRWPIVYTLFAILGAAALLFSKHKKLLLVLGAWFFAFFLIYGFFYAGSFNYGVDVRFSLTLYPALVIFAAYGFAALKDLLKKITNWRNDFFNVVIIAVIALLFLPFASYVSAIGNQAIIAREQHDFGFAELDKIIDDKCIVMNHVPSMWLVMGKTSMQTWFGQNQPIMDWAFNITDNCVYFYEAYWCGTEPYKSSVCNHMHSAFDLTQIAQTSAVEGTLRNITLYRVNRK
ncbi:MAG: glycosyltransferase family 39 protein [Candidatus Aenigmatarchaeota archaeon]